MKLREWLPAYARIARILGLNPVADTLSAALLLLVSLGRLVPQETIRALLEDKTVVVVGAGPTAARDLEKLKSRGLLDEAVIVAADDAVLDVLAAGLKPRVLVTDLDGSPAVLAAAARSGAIPVVLGHGDNLAAVLRVRGLFPRILPTSQTLPLPNTPVTGGFTDGDRAVFLAVGAGARNVLLAGMSLAEKPRAYPGKQKKSSFWFARKKAKLRIASALLEWLKTRGAPLEAVKPAAGFAPKA